LPCGRYLAFGCDLPYRTTLALRASFIVAFGGKL